MRPQAFAWSLVVAALVAIDIAAMAPAVAQSQQQLQWCNGKDGATPDQQIDSCTAVIAAGKYSGHNLAIAFNNRGSGYDKKNDYDRAIADYDQSIRLDPNYATALRNRGKVRYKKDDYDGSIADLDKAIRIEPKNADAYIDRANAYSDKGDHDRAISNYNEAIRLS